MYASVDLYNIYVTHTRTIRAPYAGYARNTLNTLE